MPEDLPVPMSGRRIFALGSYHLVLIGLLTCLLVVLWPTSFEESPTPPVAPGWSQVDLFGGVIWIHREVQLLLLVMIGGALGSYFHSAKSFADYAGNRKLYTSWTWFYVLLPCGGMVLAVVFYAVLRGGLLTSGSAGVNPAGAVAVAGLVGMFTDEASRKLKEVFDTLFRARDERADTLANPAPLVASLDPPTVSVGTAAPEIRARGSNLVKGSVVRVNGADRQTQFVSAGELIATLEPSDVASAGTLLVTVFTAPPGGGTSTPIPLPVLAGVAGAAGAGVGAGTPAVQ